MTGRATVDGVLPFLLRTSVRRGHDVPRRFLLVVLGLLKSSSDIFLLSWALGLIIQNGPGHPDPLAPQLESFPKQVTIIPKLKLPIIDLFLLFIF